MDFSKDLNAASATPLILTILRKEASYGYALIRQVETVSGGELCWEEGMLYPILHRLEKLGWIESFWDISEGGRKRKYYRILETGEIALSQFQQQWELMDSILRGGWNGMERRNPNRDESVKFDSESRILDDELPVSLL